MHAFMEKVYITFWRIYGHLHEPLNYKTRYLTPSPLQNRLNNPYVVLHSGFAILMRSGGQRCWHGSTNVRTPLISPLSSSLFSLPLFLLPPDEKLGHSDCLHHRQKSLVVTAPEPSKLPTPTPSLSGLGIADSRSAQAAIGVSMDLNIKLQLWPLFSPNESSNRTSMIT